MKVIYKPQGRAGEYAKFAINLYSGCIHGCRYCFVPNCVYKTRENFNKESLPRKDILKLLEIDCIKERNNIDDNVLLCFTTDPYQPSLSNNILTRNALEILRRYNVPLTILTKGGTRAIRDFDLYSEQDCFASTLTFVSDKKTKEWEPKAALFEDRFRAIKEAKKKGIKVWVSLEPVIDIKETFEIIEKTYKYVDLFKVGKVNYININIDWKDFVHKVISFLKRLNKQYYIKKDLMRYF